MECTALYGIGWGLYRETDAKCSVLYIMPVTVNKLDITKLGMNE